MGLETAQNKWTSTSSGQPNPRPQQGRLANATGAHDQTTPQECIRETETWSFPACVCKNDHVSNRLPEWSSTLASWSSLQSLLPKQGVCMMSTPDYPRLTKPGSVKFLPGEITKQGSRRGIPGHHILLPQIPARICQGLGGYQTHQFLRRHSPGSSRRLTFFSSNLAGPNIL